MATRSTGFAFAAGHAANSRPPVRAGRRAKYEPGGLSHNAKWSFVTRNVPLLIRAELKAPSIAKRVR